MRENFPHHLKKTTVLAIIVVTILFGTIPITVLEVNKIRNFTAKAATLTINPYPKLVWSAPKTVTFNVLLNEKTEKETIAVAKGEQTYAQAGNDTSAELFQYYNHEILGKNFQRIKLINNPQKDPYWVAGYKKDNNYFEVQYYPTPYDQWTYTSLVFFGTLQNE